MKHKYGKRWPDEATEVSVELHCYRHPYTQAQGFAGKRAHVANAIKAVFPERDQHNRPVFGQHAFFERQVKIWTDHCAGGEREREWAAVWGPSAIGKSCNFGVLSLFHWAAAPKETSVIICSTTLGMLRKRIFGEIVRYHSMYEGIFPGTYLDSKNEIIYDKKYIKSGIFGVAVLRGSIKEAVNNMCGVHNRYMVLIVDEAQSTRQAALEAADNLSAGCDEFVMIVMGNPESRLDPLGIYSEPKAGWASINPSMEEWQTKFGWCYFFDGLKSPGVIDPERYPYLLNKKQIDDTGQKRGYNSPKFWKQRRGFMAPEGLTETVLSEAFVATNRMRDTDTVWTEDAITVAGLDPAYSESGNRAVFTPVSLGRTMNGFKIILIGQQQYIELEADSELPINYQLARKTMTLCRQNGVRIPDLCVECSGIQSGVADIIEMEAKESPMRAHFEHAASVTLQAVDIVEPNHEEYANHVTEMWFRIYHYGRHQQIRGMSLEQMKQFCTRELVHRGHKLALQPKKDMVAQEYDSPDEADSLVCAAEVLVKNYGFIPGTESQFTLKRLDAENQRGVESESVYDDDEGYLHNDLDDR